MRYVCCQPASVYYTWQVEVLINNFIKQGVNPAQMDIVCGYTPQTGVPPNWQKMADHYSSVGFYFYPDTEMDKSYPPSIYFHLLAKHLAAVPERQNEVLFLHDSDIVFTKTPKFDHLEAGACWYLSDTNSYLNYDYIMSKGANVYHQMCTILNINPLIPKLMNSNSGGAQYIVKNTTPAFWEKVERDCHALYAHFCGTEHLHIKKSEFDYPIQKWTAGMWALLWNAWLHGHETKVTKDMDFGWVTNDISDVEKYTILHNAGVVGGEEKHKRLFYKAAFGITLPYNVELDIDPTKASWYYWQQVQETAKNTILL